MAKKIVINFEINTKNGEKSIGDLNKDGIPDIAVGATEAGENNTGQIWIIHLDIEGKVIPGRERRIGYQLGGFAGFLRYYDQFGSSITPLGDLDGDGITELAVGAWLDDGNGFVFDSGAMWILFLFADGTVKDERKITTNLGGFKVSLKANDQFGYAVSNIGDLDYDGINDIAIGAPVDDDGGTDRGAIYIIYLGGEITRFRRTNDIILKENKFSSTQGNFRGRIDVNDEFGHSIASLGDLDGDGIEDIAVGAPRDDNGSPSLTGEVGAIWILLMQSSSKIKTFCPTHKARSI